VRRRLFQKRTTRKVVFFKIGKDYLLRENLTSGWAPSQLQKSEDLSENFVSFPKSFIFWANIASIIVCGTKKIFVEIFSSKRLKREAKVLEICKRNVTSRQIVFSFVRFCEIVSKFNCWQWTSLDKKRLSLHFGSGNKLSLVSVRKMFDPQSRQLRDIPALVVVWGPRRTEKNNFWSF
jgi:hypothetical protein